MIYFIITILILLFLIIAVGVFLAIKLNIENKTKTKDAIVDYLDEKGFFPKETLFVNRNLSFALNKNCSKLALLENFNPYLPNSCSYQEIVSSFINSIEKNHFNIKLNYIKKGDKNTIYINPVNKETSAFFHDFFMRINVKKIENKYPEQNFSIVESSDWECSYIWAYNEKNSKFAYLKTEEKPIFNILNLRKEHFTLDVRYNYFELPILGLRQQILVYNNNFLNNLFNSFFNLIKEKTSCVLENLIYYDSFNNIVYISNGTSSLQSLIIDKIEEIYYKNNNIYFSLYDETGINFFATPKFISGFEDFITNYNLRKIAQGFDYSVDKLINTTDYTKFIIDITRSRVIYCANLNKLEKFSYLILNFSEIEKITTENYNNKSFVRIQTKEEEIIDVSCNKQEVAHYITAQIKNIIE